MTASVLDEAGISCNIALFSSAGTLMRRLQEQPGCFDMLILDILLGAENGVEMARTLRETGYQGGILFITSSKDHSIAGYSVYPIHYLLKPIQYGALKEALLRDYHQRFQPPAISVPVKGGYATIPLDAILYVESSLHSLIVHTTERDTILVMTLKAMKELLPQGAFLQCHKSFLVQMGKIHSFTRSRITLVTGQRLPVGRVYYAEALTAFIDYMEKK